MEQNAEEKHYQSFLAAQSQLQSGRMDLDATLAFLAERALVMTPATGAAFAVLHDNELICRAAAGVTAPILGARLDPANGLSGECVRSGETLRCEDTEIDPRVDLVSSRVLGVRSIVFVPIAHHGKVVAVFGIFSSRPRAFDFQHTRLLQSMAALLPPALLAGQELPQPAMPTLLEQKQVAVPSPTTSASVPPSRVLAASEISPPTNYGIPEYHAFDPRTVRPTSTVKLWLVLLFVIVAGLYLIGGLQSLMRETMVTAAHKARETLARKNKKPAAPAAAHAIPAAPSATPTAPEIAPAVPAAGGTQLMAVHVSSQPESTHVVLELTGSAEYRSERLQSPDRVYFDLYRTDLVPALAWKVFEVHDRHIERVRVAQSRPGVTRVVVELRDSAEFSNRFVSDPPQLVITVRPRSPADEAPE